MIAREPAGPEEVGLGLGKEVVAAVDRAADLTLDAIKELRAGHA